MDKNLIEQYKQSMMETYRQANRQPGQSVGDARIPAENTAQSNPAPPNIPEKRVPTPSTSLPNTVAQNTPVPNEMTPNNITPNNATPSNPMPNNTMPRNPMPNNTMPRNPMPRQPGGTPPQRQTLPSDRQRANLSDRPQQPGRPRQSSGRTVPPGQNGLVSSGKLQVITSYFRSIYPIKGAKVTVYTGDPQNRETVVWGYTDESGKTKEFILDTPDIDLSLKPDPSSLPYSLYHIGVTHDGFVEVIYLNVPIFPGRTTLQRVDMILLETAGPNKGPIIYDQAEKKVGE